MYWIYVLKSSNLNKSYVGITDNLERRIEQHNSGKHPYTKRYMPWQLIYKEAASNRIDARAREKYLKSGSGREWMRYNIFP